MQCPSKQSDVQRADEWTSVEERGRRHRPRQRVDERGRRHRPRQRVDERGRARTSPSHRRIDAPSRGRNMDTGTPPVPVTVFTGFVGSGKTTMILGWAHGGTAAGVPPHTPRLSLMGCTGRRGARRARARWQPRAPAGADIPHRAAQERVWRRRGYGGSRPRNVGGVALTGSHVRTLRPATGRSGQPAGAGDGHRRRGNAQWLHVLRPCRPDGDGTAHA